MLHVSIVKGPPTEVQTFTDDDLAKRLTDHDVETIREIFRTPLTGSYNWDYETANAKIRRDSRGKRDERTAIIRCPSLAMRVHCCDARPYLSCFAAEEVMLSMLLPSQKVVALYREGLEPFAAQEPRSGPQKRVIPFQETAHIPTGKLAPSQRVVRLSLGSLEETRTLTVDW